MNQKPKIGGIDSLEQEKLKGQFCPNQPGTQTGVAAHALDPKAASQLWEVSLDLLNNRSAS